MHPSDPSQSGGLARNTRPVLQHLRLSERSTLWKLLRLLFTTTLVVAVSGTASAATLTHVYDEAGRLVGSIAETGEAVQYVYDAAGNVIAINRSNAGDVALIEFSPNSAPVGGTVILSGSGFDTSASGNTVKFNGRSATVMSATSTTLTVTVPSGATTGKITVAVGTATATSLESFVVSPAASAPSISSFTPTLGAAGTLVTINGSNLKPLFGAPNTTINNRPLVVTSSAADAIVVKIPSTVGGGPISVQTANGSVMSSQDMFIVPQPYRITDIVSTGRLTVGQTQTLALDTAGKAMLLLFDANSGQRLRLDASNVTFNLGRLQVNGSGTEQLLSGSLQSGAFFEPFNVAATGSHSVVISVSSATGSLNLTIKEVPPDVFGSLSTSNQPTPVQITAAGQNAALVFDAAAGKKLSIQTSDTTIPLTKLSVLQPNGAVLTWTNVGKAPTLAVDAEPILASGQHTLLIDPITDGTGQIVVSATLR